MRSNLKEAARNEREKVAEFVVRRDQRRKINKKVKINERSIDRSTTALRGSSAIIVLRNETCNGHNEIMACGDALNRKLLIR